MLNDGAPAGWPVLGAGATANRHRGYWRSYSPLLTRLRTVKPDFFASEIESGFSFTGELNVEITFRTGRLHAGQRVSGGAASGLRSVNFPPHTLQSPSQSSYSYRGTDKV